METLPHQPWTVARQEEDEEEEEEAEVEEEEEDEEERGGRTRTAIEAEMDEDEDEDSEPEPPAVVRRKVSFADAFGLDLVYVKEFDTAGLEQEEVPPPATDVHHTFEEFYLSCLFTVPSTPEELDQRLQDQKLELENIELLPGTSCLRGTIRVLNLCYSKSVYVRITLDSWKSHFDLLAEYVPGSSDKKTDRFTFRYTLMPPFDKEGSKVEFCLRYETSVGIFWANNKDLNYVLFCHQRSYAKEVKVNEQDSQGQQESLNNKGKRGCLKINRKDCTEDNTDKPSARATDVQETAAATHSNRAEGADRETVDTKAAKTHSILHHEDQTPSVENMKSRRRAERQARVQDYFSQRNQDVAQVHSEGLANGVADPRPYRVHHQPLLSSPWGRSYSFCRIRHKKAAKEKPQILTYHQIPLLTLDWSSDKKQRSGDLYDLWTEGTQKGSKTSADEMDNGPTVSELWEAFLNGTDEEVDENISVSDIWQAFLNGPACKDHSNIPESEWLQTAASVSPSDHKKEPQTHCAMMEGRYPFKTRSDVASGGEARVSAEPWPVSHDHMTLLDNGALNANVQQPGNAGIISPSGGDVTVFDTSKKSEASTVTDTPQKSGPSGAALASEDSVDSRTWQQQESAAQGMERKGDGGGGGMEEPFTPCTAGPVTSSGETGPAKMTATPASQNASAVDRISQGTRLDKGLFSYEKGEGTGTAHNATDDTLAFRETIGLGTEDGGRYALFISGQGERERFTPSQTDRKVYTEREIFRPQQTEESRISQRYGDEKECEEFRLSQNSEDALRQNKSDGGEIRQEQSHADELKLNQTPDKEFSQSQIGAAEFKLDDSKQDKVAPRYAELDEYGLGQTEKGGWGVEPNFALELLGQSDEMSSGVNTADTDLKPDKRLGLIQTVDEVCAPNGPDADDLTHTIQTEENLAVINDEKAARELISCQTAESISYQSHDGMITKEQEASAENMTHRISASIQMHEEPFEGGELGEDQSVETPESEEASNAEHDDKSFIDRSAHELNSNEALPLRWKEPLHVRSQKEDIDGKISPSAEDEMLENISDLQDALEALVDGVTLSCLGELETEAVAELISDTQSIQEGNIQVNMREEQVISMGIVESSGQNEEESLSGVAKDPISADDIGAVQSERGVEVEELSVEDAEPLLDEGILSQMTDLKVEGSTFGKETLGDESGYRLSDKCDLCHAFYLNETGDLLEEGLTEAFDSGIFSFTELLTHPNLTSAPREERGHNLAVSGDDHSVTQSTSIAQTRPIPVKMSCFTLAEKVTTESDVPQSLTQSSPTLAGDQDGVTQITDNSVTHRETHGYLEDCAVSQHESLSQLSPLTSPKTCRSSSENLDNSVFVWWTVFYSLSHVRKMLAYALLVTISLVTTFLYDWPACFALHAFAVCWWCYQWKRHRQAKRIAS